jgi:alpha-D-xyloside xylohydrolase
MPYIYSLAGMVTHDDYTIMRALVMDFGDDDSVHNIGDQFMFGPAFLISPVTEYKARSRKVYLPEGTGWYDFKRGEYYKGGQTIEADAPYTEMPIFVREGSIIPFGPAIQYTTEKPADHIRLIVYTGEDAAFTLYEDENINYNYEQGAYSEIPFIYNEDSKSLTIGARQGEFPGMLKSRVFEIVWIDKDKPAAFNLAAAPVRAIRYNGREVTVKRK